MLLLCTHLAPFADIARPFHTPSIDCLILWLTVLQHDTLQTAHVGHMTSLHSNCLHESTKSNVMLVMLLSQVCIFRNAVRRALKGISEALERMEGSQAGSGDTLQACRAVTTVVGQIAQSVHRLQKVPVL